MAVYLADGRIDHAERFAHARLAASDQPTAADSLMWSRGLARVTQLRGDDIAAIGWWTQVHESTVRLHGPESPEAGLVLHDLGATQRNAGRLTDALRTYRATLELRGRVLGPDHIDVAWTLNNLANVYFDLGDFAEAASMHRRALTIREARWGADHAQVALSLMNLANALERRGDVSTAIRLHERALAIHERVNGPWHRSVAQNLNNLALAHMSAGDLATARPMFERSISIRDSLFGPGSAEAARSRLRLGLLHLSADSPVDAARVLSEAVDADRRQFGKDHPLRQDAAIALAVADLRLGREGEALDLALAAERATIGHLRLTAQGLDESQALLFSSSRSSGLQVLLSLAASRPSDSAIVFTAWDALVRSRSVVLDEMVARRRWSSAASADSAARRMSARVSAARDHLARLALQGPWRDSTQEARRRTATEEKGRAEEALADANRMFGAEMRSAEAGLPEVRAALPAGAALVSFVWFEQLPIGGAATDTVSQVAAMVLTSKEARPIMVPLGPAPEVDRAIRAWLSSQRRQPHPLRRAQDEAACAARGRRVRALVWEPVARLVDSAERVFIVSDGLLQITPLGALPDLRGRTLIEHGPLLHPIATERDLLSTMLPDPTGKGLLAIGAPAFDRSPSSSRSASAAYADACAIFRGGRFEALPESLSELTDVARTWDAARGGSDVLPDERARVASGAQATERAIRSQAGGRRALHIATHGFFLPTNCSVSLSGDTHTSLAHRHPLLRSAIALAGANQRSDSQDAADDGILTAEEVAGLDLASLEWVVLSACETGLGELDGNEGVLGMRRAFRAAGANALVMSLWRVDDAASADWMRALYDARFRRKLDAAAATRAAGTRMIQERRARGLSTHPYYWAAFVSEGGATGP